MDNTSGHYRVIMADPPWQYRVWSGKPYGGGSRTAESHYETMSLDELKAMHPQIDSWAAEDCALFLWATPPTIEWAFELIDAWGFTYKTFGFIWMKTTKKGSPFIGMGHYTRANAEPCLLSIRGRMPPQDKGVSQVIQVPRRTHSRKPDETYERIERMYDGPYLELFARKRCENWDAWGNEAN